MSDAPQCTENVTQGFHRYRCCNPAKFHVKYAFKDGSWDEHQTCGVHVKYYRRLREVRATDVEITELKSA